MNVEMINIDSVVLDPRNPRKMSQSEFEDLQRSIDEFGFVECAVVNKRNMNVCSGHQRIRAARALGFTEIPVFFVDLDDQHQLALNVAMNKISGEFDNDMLAELLSTLDDDLLLLTGFDEDWADQLQPIPDIDEDKADDKIHEPKFTTDELRTLCKSLYPTQSEIILDFLRIVDERSDKH
jgi:hypothetical protein